MSGNPCQRSEDRQTHTGSTNTTGNTQSLTSGLAGRRGGLSVKRGSIYNELKPEAATHKKLKLFLLYGFQGFSGLNFRALNDSEILVDALLWDTVFYVRNSRLLGINKKTNGKNKRKASN